jgi:lipopolysaccharide exporter
MSTAAREPVGVPDPERVPGVVTGRSTARGGLWTVLAETSQRLAQTLCFFLLAAVLSPKQFGLAAVAFLMVQIVNSLTYAGLGPAVQALGPDAARDRTVVGMALCCGCLGAAVMALSAGPVCAALGAPDARHLVQLVGLSLPLTQLAEVTGALLDRDLRFSETALAQVLGSASSTVVGVTAALAGAGATALILQTVVLQGVRAGILLLRRPDTLRMALHRRQAEELWGVGRDLLTTSVLVTAYGNLDNATVGAVSGPTLLGGYAFVYNLTNLPYFLIGLAANRVVLPTYKRLQLAGQPLGTAYETAVRAAASISALPLGFLAVAGPDAVDALFGAKWHDVYATLRLLCVFAWVRTVAATSAPVLIALGRTPTQRRVQQLQLLAMLVLVVPATMLAGPLGTAAAVTIPMVVGAGLLVKLSARLTEAKLSAVAGRVGEGLLLGLLSGVAGWLGFQAAAGPLGLLSGLVGATTVWAVVVVVVLPAELRRLLRHSL